MITLLEGTKTIVKYTKELQDVITAECTQLRKRMKLINKKALLRGFRFKYEENANFNVMNQDFTAPELKKEFQKRYRSIKLRTKPMHYQKMIGNFQRAARGKALTGIQAIYKFHKKKIIGEINGAKTDLRFCMNTIISMNSVIKAESTRRKKVYEMTNMSRSELKKVLYERCAAGEITVDEREELLAKESDEHFFEEMYRTLIPLSESEEQKLLDDETPVTENTGTEDEEEASFEFGNQLRERYEEMRTAIYENCAEGRITITERENLLANLKDYLLKKEGE